MFLTISSVFQCFLVFSAGFFPVQVPCFHANMHQDTPLVMVRSESDLKEMIQEIKSTCIGKEIAVDVEHHDFRWEMSFMTQDALLRMANAFGLSEVWENVGR